MCDTLAVQELYLSNNKIGDAGVTALANACASGSLASLKKLVVPNGCEKNPQLKAACSKCGIDLV